MRRHAGWIHGGLALAAALLPPAARGLPLEILEASRRVEAEATAFVDDAVDPENDVDFQADAAESDVAAGPLAVSVMAAFGGAEAGAGATQEASLTADALAGEAASHADAAAPAAAQGALASAGSLLRILFEATAAVELRLTGRVEAAGAGASDGAAIFQLARLDVGLDPLLLFQAAPGEQQRFDEVVPLVAGARYELVAIADALADAFDAEPAAGVDAAVSFALRIVPEPGSAALLALALAGLARRRISRAAAPRAGGCRS